jgi:hypothetical protein
MRRRSFWMAIIIVISLVAGAGSALAVLVGHEPSSYHRCAIPPGAERAKLSGEFVNEFTNRLLGGVLDKRKWDARFNEQQINSYFQEDFLNKHNEENPLPAGMSEPRIALDTDRIRFGFRYGTGIWSTVVTLDLRAWLVVKEANTIALEFRSLHAGAIPISAQWLLERVSESARLRDIEVTWYRNQGRPVLVLRFQAQRTSPTFQLTKLKIQDGMLLIEGRSLDTTPLVVGP